MGLMQIDFGEIAELGTRVAMHGALRLAEIDVDDMFELVVGVVILIHEIAPIAA